MITYLLSAIGWFGSALANFAYSPTGMISSGLSFLFVLLGFIFTFASFKSLSDAFTERNVRKVTL